MFSSFSISISVVVLSQAFIKDSRKAFVEKLFITHASKVMLKIHQARFQQFLNQELPDVQTGFRKGRGTRDQIDNIFCLIQKAREFQINIYLFFTDYAKAFDCVDHNKLENS